MCGDDTQLTQCYLAIFEHSDKLGRKLEICVTMPLGDFDNSWRQALEMALSKFDDSSVWLLRELKDIGFGIATQHEAEA